MHDVITQHTKRTLAPLGTPQCQRPKVDTTRQMLGGGTMTLMSFNCFILFPHLHRKNAVRRLRTNRCLIDWRRTKEKDDCQKHDRSHDYLCSALLSLSLVWFSRDKNMSQNIPTSTSKMFRLTRTRQYKNSI